METRLLCFLGEEWSIDYWSDVAILEARDIANLATEPEWSEIRHSWTVQASTVQERLAQIAGLLSDAPPVVVEMLVDMLGSDNDEVVEASIDAINGIAQVNPAKVKTQRVQEAIGRVSPRGKLAKMVLESLKMRLEK